MRFSLASLLLAILACALLLGAGAAYWKPDHPNHNFWLALYLLAVSVAAIAALHPRARWRAGFAGTALFGVLNLAFTLRGGFDVRLLTDAEWFAHYAQFSLALLPAAFLVTQLTANLCWPEEA